MRPILSAHELGALECLAQYLGTETSRAFAHLQEMAFGRAHEQRSSRVERRATIRARGVRCMHRGVPQLVRLADEPRGPI